MRCSQTLVSELPVGSGHFLALHSVYQPLYQNPSSKPFLSVVMGVPPSGLRCCCRETGVPRDVCRTRPAFSVVGHQPHGLFPCEGEGKTSAMETLIRLLCLFLNSRILVPSVKAACLISLFSPVRLFATPWTLAHQAPLSMGFSRQEYWSGLPCPPPGDLPNPGVEPMTPQTHVNRVCDAIQP